MRLPHRLQGQKVKSQGGAGAYCGGHLAAQLVFAVVPCCLLAVCIATVRVMATQRMTDWLIDWLIIGDWLKSSEQYIYNALVPETPDCARRIGSQTFCSVAGRSSSPAPVNDQWCSSTRRLEACGPAQRDVPSVMAIMRLSPSHHPWHECLNYSEARDTSPPPPCCRRLRQGNEKNVQYSREGARANSAFRSDSFKAKHCIHKKQEISAWRRRLLQAKTTSYILVAVLRVFFLLLTRLLSNGWTDFHQIFTNRRPCGVIH